MALDPLSTLISGAFDIGNTALSAEFSRRAQKRQIAWERERATHAHQWEVQDLINAGLNPILSAGGSGAVTGGISAPVPDTSGLSEIKNSIQTGIQAKTAKKEQKLLDEQTEQTKSQAALNKANETKALIDSANTAEDTRRLKAEADKAEAEYRAIKPLLETDEKYNKSTVGKGLHYLNRAWGDTGGAITTIGIGGVGAAKILGGRATAKAAAQAAKSQAFKNEISKGVPLPKHTDLLIRPRP